MGAFCKWMWPNKSANNLQRKTTTKSTRESIILSLFLLLNIFFSLFVCQGIYECHPCTFSHVTFAYIILSYKFSKLYEKSIRYWKLNQKTSSERTFFLFVHFYFKFIFSVFFFVVAVVKRTHTKLSVSDTLRGELITSSPPVSERF